MQEWPDDKLDAFFRKLSEEQDPRFESKDWESLKNRLDEADGKAGSWWKNPVWKGVLVVNLLVISVSLLLFREKGLTISGTKTKTMANANARPPFKPEYRSTEGARASVPETKSQGAAPVRSIPENTSTGRPTDVLISKKRSRQSNDTGGEIVATGVRGTPRADETYLFSDSPVHNLRINAPWIEPGSSGSELVNREELPLLTPPEVSMPDPIPLLEISMAEKPKVDPVADNLPQQEGRWAVRLGAGPDFSTVGLSRISNPTFTWAAHLDYRLAGKLWFQTGYVKSNKEYHAQAGKYTWPSGWYQDVLPESVDATCQMIEIPLNLKYTWGGKGRSSTYVAVGATNYQMQNEQYNYNYLRDDPSIKWRRWQGSTGWYWLSHVHISVGHERKLNQNWRIGVEPFVKIPTQKVGYGNVNLYTAGTWMYLSFGR